MRFTQTERAEQGVFVLGRLTKGEAKRGETRLAREAGAGRGRTGSFVHAAGYFYGNIAAPFVFRLSSRSSLSTFARYWWQPLGYIWIGGKRRVAPFPTGMKNNVAESVFRHPLKATARNPRASSIFIRDNFRPAKTIRPTARPLTPFAKTMQQTARQSRYGCTDVILRTTFRRSLDKRAARLARKIIAP